MSTNHVAIPSSEKLRDIFANFKKNESDAVEIARSLCANYIGGIWMRAPAEDFSLKPLTGGMSNLLFIFQVRGNHKPNECTKALLRIHCQGDLSSQLTESVVFTLLSERNLGPRLLGVFPGGRFEQFLPSQCLSCDDISQPKWARLLSPIIAQVHMLDVPISKEPQVFVVARNWLKKLKDLAGNKTIEITTKKTTVNKNAVPKSVTVDDIEKELAFYEHFFDKYDCPIVFSHNDLQEGNFLLNEGYSMGSEGLVANDNPPPVASVPVTLIDFEYASYNFRAFDLGNHFCEYAFDYSTTEAPFYEVHTERFHDVEGRKAFAEAYVNKIYELHETRKIDIPTELASGDKAADVLKVIEESTMFMSLSHIFWTCWSLLNAETSVVSFDYASYGRDRLALYYNEKHYLLDYLAKH